MKKKLWFLILVSLLLSLSICQSSYSADKEWYVDDGTGEDTDTGATEALAWKTVQKALDTFALNGSANTTTRINIKNTNTYNIDPTIDADTTTGLTDQVVIIEGYTSTIGDGGQAIFDCDAGASQSVNCVLQDNLIDNYVWRNITFQDSSDDTFNSAGDQTTWEGCVFKNSGDMGLLGSADHRVFNSEFSGNADDDFSSAGQWTLMYNYFHDGVQVADLGNDDSAFLNIMDTYSSASSGIRLSGHSIFVSNTVYNTTASSNIIVASDGPVIINNLLHTASAYNINYSNHTTRMSGFNSFQAGSSGTTTGFVAVDLGGNQTVDPGLTDAPGGDFSIGANLDDLGYPATYKGSATTSHLEMGASMYEETPGGGGAEPSSGYSN